MIVKSFVKKVSELRIMEVKLKLWMKNIVNNERWLHSHSKIEVCCRCPLFGSLIMTHLHSFMSCLFLCADY